MENVDIRIDNLKDMGGNRTSNESPEAVFFSTDTQALPNSLCPGESAGQKQCKEPISGAGEHGHKILMDYLADKLENIQSMADHPLTLIEIGSTRENLPGQGSTKKLAEFCNTHGLHFITVDMDPQNTRQAQSDVSGINPRFEAVNQKGEEFLNDYSDPVDFVFLDAYDFDHGQHSQNRQTRYEKHLGSRISDEACHQMHLECARHLAKKLSPFGVVCIDDTWIENGRWTAKGTLAVPYLLSHHFNVALYGNKSALFTHSNFTGHRSHIDQPDGQSRLAENHEMPSEIATAPVDGKRYGMASHNGGIYLPKYPSQCQQSGPFSALDLLTRFYYETLSQPVLVDIGPGNGEFAEPFAIGKWHVIAIEPKQQQVPIIRERLARYQNINIISPAADQCTDAVQGNTIINPCHALNLEEHLSSLGIEHVSLLKISGTTGNNLRVLKTFDIETLSPEIIICRLADDNRELQNSNCHDIVRVMAPYSYEAFIAEWDSTLSPSTAPSKGASGFHRLMAYSPTSTPEAGNVIMVRSDKLNTFKDTIDRYHHFYEEKIGENNDSSSAEEQRLLHELNQAYEKQNKDWAMQLLAELFEKVPRNESIAHTYIDNLTNAAFPSDENIENARKIVNTARSRFPRSETIHKKARFVEMLDAENRGFKQLWHFKNEHMGERCVIIGNGPSLNKMDLSFLKNEACFGFNRIYLGFDKWGFVPTYYLAVNNLVIEQFAADIVGIPCTKFISSERFDCLPPSDDTIFIRSRISYDGDFSRDPRKGLFLGSTVTYVALQMAYYMGFKEVILIGVDHKFKSTGQPHAQTTSNGNDPDHFTPGYWGAGGQWHLPDLDHSAKMYALADQFYKKDRRRIIDATVDGHCPVFDKADYREIFFNQNSTAATVASVSPPAEPAVAPGTGTINFIDVGSAGEIPSPWDQNRGRLGYILKFEPRDNASDDPNITTIDCALWEKEEERPFYIYKGLNGTGFSLFEQNTEWVNANFDDLKILGDKWLADTWHDRDRLVKTETIHCRTLDSVLTELDKPFAYDFLKIDAQGAEYNILKGAENYLNTQCIGLHLELFVIPLYKDIKLLHEVKAYLRRFGFVLAKTFPPHGSFHSQHDCLFLKPSADPDRLRVICDIYGIEATSVMGNQMSACESSDVDDADNTVDTTFNSNSADHPQTANGTEDSSEQAAERFNTKCPHCAAMLEITQKGKWQCPVCEGDFMV
ncbi:MAG: FkbM family methyltransferase [Thermodesulfobacteriota bacterium]|nr:FkbM family methyltransferase [Thermodesulfobacteriota bacterium]